MGGIMSSAVPARPGAARKHGPAQETGALNRSASYLSGELVWRGIAVQALIASSATPEEPFAQPSSLMYQPWFPVLDRQVTFGQRAR